MQARGRKKRGAHLVLPGDTLCEIAVSDGSTFTTLGCMRGSVVEVNKRLIEQPELLGKPEGYVAVLVPKAEKSVVEHTCLQLAQDHPSLKRKLERLERP